MPGQAADRSAAADKQAVDTQAVDTQAADMRAAGMQAVAAGMRAERAADMQAVQAADMQAEQAVWEQLRAVQRRAAEAQLPDLRLSILPFRLPKRESVP